MPPGGNIGAPAPLPNWAPDLKTSEKRLTFALLVKF
jgi:hypothetical protein